MCHKLDHTRSHFGCEQPIASAQYRKSHSVIVVPQDLCSGQAGAV